MYKLTLVTAPAVEPVTYSELCDHLRIDDQHDRALVTALGVAGREYVEQRTRQTLINTTYEVAFDGFYGCSLTTRCGACSGYGCGLVLPRHPVSSITSVSYIDGDGATQTLGTSVYTIDTKSTGRTTLALKPGQAWPTTGDYPNAVTIRFVAGMSANAAGVPEALKLAIKSWAAAAYENREAVAGRNAVSLPHAFDAILALYSRPEA